MGDGPVCLPQANRCPPGAILCLEQAREALRTADFDSAERLLKNAIEQDPRLALAYELLGKLLYRDSRAEEAAAVYRAWLGAMPSDPVAAHLVAATGGAPAPERASDGFIASLFGRAAPEFDVALATLGYRAPQLVFERAAAVLDPGAVALEVLDLGCGTGLCGDWFRPLARRLVGVDLSDGMLEEARRRKCYDALVCQELTAYVETCADRFDLITAADVFCYFGDLSTSFAAVARLLRADGWFIFSVEEAGSAEAGCAEARSAGEADAAKNAVLLEHGRYAHGVAHVERALVSAGLGRSVIHRDTLRFERGLPVQGLIVAARR
jgi:predicted TPR repeat methyltransferase